MRSQILVDGVRLNQSADELNATGWQLRNIVLQALKTRVSSDSRTIKVQWFTPGGRGPSAGLAMAEARLKRNARVFAGVDLHPSQHPQALASGAEHVQQPL